MFGKALGTLIGVITIGLLTRYLGAEGYGQFTIIFSFLAIFAVLVDFGLTLTTVQMISEERDDHEEIFSNILSLRIASSIVFLSIAPFVSLLFPYDSVIRWGIAIGAIMYIFNSTTVMVIGIFQKHLVMSRAIIAELTNRIIILLGILLAPILGLSLLHIVGIFILGNGANLAINLYYARKFIAFKFTWNSKIIKEVLSRSWPLGIAIFFNLIYLRGDILFLSIWESVEQIGQYGAAYKVVDVMTAIPVMFMGLLLPILTNAWSKKDYKTFRTNMQNGFDFLSYTGIPFAFGTLALSVPVMVAIAGEEFVEGGKILMLFGPVVLMLFFSSLFGHAVIAVQKQREITWGYALIAIITIAGYVLYIPEYGIWAAAWWTLIAETLAVILTFFVVWKASKFIPSTISLIRALTASIIMYGAITFIELPNVFLQVSFGIIVYIIMIHLFGGPNIIQTIKLFIPEKSNSTNKI